MSRWFSWAAVAAGMLWCTATANAAFLTFQGPLSGQAEFPPNNSPATGFSVVRFDPIAHLLEVQAVFSGLTGTTTASHIHVGVPTGGVATTTPTFPGFPNGVTSGSYQATFNTTLASTYRAGFITANGGTVASAEAALFAALRNGTAYLNIHTTTFTGGEIRGYLLETPEPATWAMWSLGAVGCLIWRRRRR